MGSACLPRLRPDLGFCLVKFVALPPPGRVLSLNLSQALNIPSDPWEQDRDGEGVEGKVAEEDCGRIRNAGDPAFSHPSLHCFSHGFRLFVFRGNFARFAF